MERLEVNTTDLCSVSQSISQQPQEETNIGDEADSLQRSAIFQLRYYRWISVINQLEQYESYHIVNSRQISILDEV